MNSVHKKIKYSDDWHDLISSKGPGISVHMICLSGKGHFRYNNHSINFYERDILVVPQSLQMDELWVSEDIQVEILFSSNQFLENQLPEVHFGISGMIELSYNPVLSVSKEDADIFMQDIHRIKDRLNRTEHYFLDQMLGSMALTMMYDLFNFRAKIGGVNQQSDGNSYIVKRLTLLLSSGSTKTNRDVGYYADKLGVSMKYLSKTARRQVGQTVKDLIVLYTKPIIINLLNNPNISVAQIADIMNFASSSYFTKYCIKHLGMSPTKFRSANRPTYKLDME